MRQDCKYFESRTYPNGETVRKCNLDLAPEAPWRCPDDCPKFERRLADVNWGHGTLVTPPTPDEPLEPSTATTAPWPPCSTRPRTTSTPIGAQVLAEVEAEQSRRRAASSGSSAASASRRSGRPWEGGQPAGSWHAPGGRYGPWFASEVPPEHVLRRRHRRAGRP